MFRGDNQGDRHVLVVGGTKGIGRAVAGYFLQRGVEKVSLLGRTLPRTEDGFLNGAKCFQADLQDLNQVQLVMDDCVRERGKFTDIIFSQRHRGEADDWASMSQVSWKAIDHFLGNINSWFSSDGGSVVMVSSPAATTIVNEQAPSYHIAKAGLEQLVRYYAVQLGARGIRVNGVSPAIVIKEESQTYFATQFEMVKALENAMPLKKIPTANDVADVIGFLCSSASRCFTGQILMVDGGLSLRAPATLVLESLK